MGFAKVKEAWEKKLHDRIDTERGEISHREADAFIRSMILKSYTVEQLVDRIVRQIRHAGYQQYYQAARKGQTLRKRKCHQIPQTVRKPDGTRVYKPVNLLLRVEQEERDTNDANQIRGRTAAYVQKTQEAKSQYPTFEPSLTVDWFEDVSEETRAKRVKLDKVIFNEV